MENISLPIHSLDIDDYDHLTRSQLLSVILSQAEQYYDLKRMYESKIQEFETKINWLDEQLRLLKSKHYGKSSEQQSSLQSPQMELFDEDEEALQCESPPCNDPQKESITYTRSKPDRSHKNIDTSHLPREKKVYELSEEEKSCACCNQLMVEFGEESKEEIIFIKPSMKVIEHVRKKYTCRHCDSAKMPAVIELPLSKSKASQSLVAEIILNKYRYHLPFYRQSKLFKSHGLLLADSTLAGWVMEAAERLSPLREAFYMQLVQVNVLQGDETPVKVLQPEKQGYMWVYHCYLAGKKFIVFEFSLTRSSSVVNERLKEFKGILQTDGYSGYEALRQREDIISLGCWDHARRKFADVVKAAGNNKSGKAGDMLEKIGKLYDIEREIKDLPFEERKVIRQEQAKPKLDAIYSFLQKINASPKTLLGQAVTYAKNQWETLIRYVDHGAAQISNAWIENQIRPFALGKRNWLFVGNEVSAQKAALLYSLIQSCELNNIDPRAYLEYVLQQVHRLRRKEVDPMTLLPNTIDQKLLNTC